jgi:hypothetical protein
MKAPDIPPGVFIPRTMPLAAGFDPEFDARWLGWNSPAGADRPRVVGRSARPRMCGLGGCLLVYGHDAGQGVVESVEALRLLVAD